MAIPLRQPRPLWLDNPSPARSALGVLAWSCALPVMLVVMALALAGRASLLVAVTLLLRVRDAFLPPA